MNRRSAAAAPSLLLTARYPASKPKRDEQAELLKEEEAAAARAQAEAEAEAARARVEAV